MVRHDHLIKINLVTTFKILTNFRAKIFINLILIRSQETGLPVSVRVRVANRTFNLHKVSNLYPIKAVKTSLTITIYLAPEGK